jgi:hypothetical protein
LLAVLGPAGALSDVGEHDVGVAAGCRFRQGLGENRRLLRARDQERRACRAGIRDIADLAAAK